MEVYYEYGQPISKAVLYELGDLIASIASKSEDCPEVDLYLRCLSDLVEAGYDTNGLQEVFARVRYNTCVRGKG